MKRRRVTQDKWTYVELTTVGSGVWTVPNRVYSIDVFIVGGGSDGTRGYINTTYGDTYISSGNGGKGGNRMTYNGYKVTPGQQISYEVGGAGGSSVFGVLGVNATTGQHSNNAASVTMIINPEYGELEVYPQDPRMGSDGIKAFSHVGTLRYGAGGGGGGMMSEFSSPGPMMGGETGGGAGGDIPNETPPNENYIAGFDATFYGGGGGGGGTIAEFGWTGPGGKGYQGVIIIRYRS